MKMASSESDQSRQQLCLAGSRDLALPASPCASPASLPAHQHGLAPAVNNHGQGPQRRASAANELLGLSLELWRRRLCDCLRGKPTHATKGCLLTHAYTPSIPLIPFPMHMFTPWLWRKGLNRGCSKTDALSVMFASGDLFASKGVANVVFSRIVFALDSAKHKSEAGRRSQMPGS